MIKITKQNFEQEVENSDKPVLLKFSSEWCAPCKMLEPIIEEIEKENSNIKFGSVIVDEEVEISTKYRILSIPTLVLIKDNKVVDTMIGLKSKKAILKMIQKHMDK